MSVRVRRRQCPGAGELHPGDNPGHPGEPGRRPGHSESRLSRPNDTHDPVPTHQGAIMSGWIPRPWRVLAPLFLMALASGCGSGRYPVTGRVTYEDGSPVEAGTVVAEATVN